MCQHRDYCVRWPKNYFNLFSIITVKLLAPPTLKDPIQSRLTTVPPVLTHPLTQITPETFVQYQVTQKRQCANIDLYLHIYAIVCL